MELRKEETCGSQIKEKTNADHAEKADCRGYNIIGSITEVEHVRKLQDYVTKTQFIDVDNSYIVKFLRSPNRKHGIKEGRNLWQLN